MTPRPRIVAAGYINVDLVARVSRLAPGDGRVTTERIETHMGGMAANVACAAAQFGARAELCGDVGDDTEGRAALDDLARLGVETAWVRIRADRRTSRTLIIVDEQGQRLIVSELYHLDLDLLGARLQELAPPAVAYTEGYHLPWALPVLAAARARGVLAVADLDGMNGPSLSADLDAVSQGLDLLVLNRALASRIAPEAEWPHLLASLRARGAQGICLTLGPDGVLVADRHGVARLPGHSVATVDSTGAGDVFTAILAVMMASGDRVYEAARWANAAGALSTTAPGARGHLPSHAEVQGLLASAPTSGGRKEVRTG